MPAVLKESMSTLRPFNELAHSGLTTILDRLDGLLDLPAGTLANKHRIMEPMECQTRILKYPPQPTGDHRASTVPHTDFGSVTLWFNKVGGLQVVPPNGDSTAWEYVRPVPSYCIINLGDAMVKFARGLLRSNLHRVTNPPGAQAQCTRFSLAYIGRPEDSIIMKGLDGVSVIPSIIDCSHSFDLWRCRHSSDTNLQNDCC